MNDSFNLKNHKKNVNHKPKLKNHIDCTARPRVEYPWCCYSDQVDRRWLLYWPGRWLLLLLYWPGQKQESLFSSMNGPTVTAASVLTRPEARIFDGDYCCFCIDLARSKNLCSARWMGLRWDHRCERRHTVVVSSPAWQGCRKRRDSSWSSSAGKREREEAVPAWQVHDALCAVRSVGWAWSGRAFTAVRGAWVCNINRCGYNILYSYKCENYKNSSSFTIWAISYNDNSMLFVMYLKNNNN
jgi:hypothetical protein